jgi:hypothetical protein
MDRSPSDPSSHMMRNVLFDSHLVIILISKFPLSLAFQILQDLVCNMSLGVYHRPALGIERPEFNERRTNQNGPASCPMRGALLVSFGPVVVDSLLVKRHAPFR